MACVVRFLCMSSVVLAASACAVAPSGLSTPEPAQVDNAVASARTAADTLQRELLAALTQAMSSSGPAGAISVCNEKAPQIASGISADTSVDIGRTALRIRNPKNAPDAWERERLAAFAAELAAGKSPAGMERYAVEQTPEGWRVRWMRPIILQPMCTSCHGADIGSDIGEILSGLYPGDQATGFQVGELRGAFTATVSLSRD
jgi:hypothetical protein